MVVGEVKKEEDGRRRAVGLCGDPKLSGHPDAPGS